MSIPKNSNINHLDRILGYRDAVNDDGDVTVVAPEILMMPFWTVDMCSAVIEAAEAVGAFSSHPDDPVPGSEISLATISPRLYENLESDVGERIWPRLQEQWPLIDYYGLKDAFIIKYSLDSQTELRIHHDVAQVSGSVKLNDVYEGARLDFPRQSFTNETVPVGSLLAWPSLVTHPHQTLPLLRGVKYGLTLWFEIPEQYF